MNIEIHVKIVDKNRGDFEHENYKSGDPIAVKKTPCVWGRREDKRVWLAEGRDPERWENKSFILQVNEIPDKHWDKIKAAVESEELRPATVAEIAFDSPDPEDRFVKVRRRSISIQKSYFTSAQRQRIIDNGFIQISWFRLRDAMRRKSDDGVLIIG